MEIDWYILVSFIIRTIALGVICLYVIPKQFLEVLRPKDWLTRLRWQLLLLFIFSAIATLPALAYQFGQLYGYNSSTLQNVARITANLSNLGTSVILVLIYKYRKNDNE